MKHQAELISSIRQKRKITQTHLAQTMGLSPQFLGQVEKGRANIPPKKARIISKALNIPFRQFSSAFALDRAEEYERKAGVK